MKKSIMPMQCAEKVYEKPRGTPFGSWRRCRRDAVHGKPHCKIHDPEVIRQREDEKMDRYRRDINARVERENIAAEAVVVKRLSGMTPRSLWEEVQNRRSVQFDAKLMAAAPDLLKLVQSTLKAAEHLDGAWVYDFCKEAERIIKMVEGRSS